MLMVAMTAICSIASAQQDVRRMPQQRERVDRTEQMVKEYGLDEKQAAQVKELNEKYQDVFSFGRPGRGPRPEMARPQGEAPSQQVAPAARPQMNGQMPSREEMEKMMNERRAKMEEYNAELKKIMTESQFESYTKRMEEMRRNRPQFGGQRPNM